MRATRLGRSGTNRIARRKLPIPPVDVKPKMTAPGVGVVMVDVEMVVASAEVVTAGMEMVA